MSRVRALASDPAQSSSPAPADEELVGPEYLAWDIVDEWGAQSFPASDPPANW